MKRVSTAALVLVAVLPLGGMLPAAAQTAAKPPASRINVYQYAVDNPVENSRLKTAPSIGASVPQAIVLVPCAEEKTYAYFYYDGRPVIVEQTTRSVVRIGQQ